MKIRLIKPAGAELDEAIRYYTDIREDLGAAFLDEVLAALKRISAHPKG